MKESGDVILILNGNTPEWTANVLPCLPARDTCLFTFLDS